MMKSKKRKEAKNMSQITYIQSGDYQIPNLSFSIQPAIQLGRYALMHQNYLKESSRIRYLNMLTSGKLKAYLQQIEKEALRQLEMITRKMQEQLGINEKLKEENPMEWTRQMNSIRSQAEEIIQSEVIFR